MSAELSGITATIRWLSHVLSKNAERVGVPEESPGASEASPSGEAAADVPPEAGLASRGVETRNGLGMDAVTLVSLFKLRRRKKCS